MSKNTHPKMFPRGFWRAKFFGWSERFFIGHVGHDIHGRTAKIWVGEPSAGWGAPKGLFDHILGNQRHLRG